MFSFNEVKLTGLISKVYPQVTTPAGIVVSRFCLEHASEKVEGGVKRKVKCKVFCVYVTGNITEEMLGCLVNTNGFLSVNTQKELVLHITNIEKLD